jgi:hypothetical protein
MSDSEIDMEQYKDLVNPKPKAKKENKWMKHVQEYRKQNPGVKYIDCLKQAKLTYNKN